MRKKKLIKRNFKECLNKIENEFFSLCWLNPITIFNLTRRYVVSFKLSFFLNSNFFGILVYLLAVGVINIDLKISSSIIFSMNSPMFSTYACSL